jgi:DNA-binding response OmpR family regulator
MSRLPSAGVRVLLVEDEAEIADFLLLGLREEGYTVEHAPGGAEGWARLSTEAWDVVLLDWWLPGIDGLTLLRRFRATNSATPVIFLTARDAVSDRVRGLDAGAEDYLCKPFAFEELLARVRSLTRRHDRRPATALTHGDVALDLDAQRAMRGGKRLDLTAKEFTLLAVFLRNAGAVLSRARIYEQVWDEEYDGLSNTLAVHVGELRRKLEVHGPRLVHTVRGTGYVFRRDQDA